MLLSANRGVYKHSAITVPQLADIIHNNLGLYFIFAVPWQDSLVRGTLVHVLTSPMSVSLKGRGSGSQIIILVNVYLLMELICRLQVMHWAPISTIFEAHFPPRDDQCCHQGPRPPLLPPRSDLLSLTIYIQLPSSDMQQQHIMLHTALSTFIVKWDQSF